MLPEPLAQRGKPGLLALPAPPERQVPPEPQAQTVQWAPQAPPVLPALRERPELRELQAQKAQWVPLALQALPVPPLPLLPGLMLLRLPIPTM